VDPATFAREFPACCTPAGIRIPNLNTAPPRVTAKHRLEKSEAGLEKLGQGAARDPAAVPEFIKTGPEALAHYRSFRLGEPWGIFVREAGLVGLREEIHRIIYRDLGRTVEKPLGREGDMLETVLALDYLTGHMHVHYLLDHHAAVLESADGTPRYLPYLDRQAAFLRQPRPGVLLDLEEALANFEGFYNFTNPGYTDPLTDLVKGSLSAEAAQSWKSFFLAGRFATEFATLLSRQPVGPRDFGKLCTRMTSVGATNYVQVRYLVNHLVREKTYAELAHRIAGGEFTAFPAQDPPKADNLLKEKPPVDAPIWVY
jgi:hypothetical protein